jgi:hypothetical protein
MNTSLIELLISLVFIFLLLSIIVSSISELLGNYVNSRGVFLKKALNDVLNDSNYNKNFSELLYDHPQVDLLKRTQERLPSYIPSKIFAETLIDVIGREYEMSQNRFSKNEAGEHVFDDTVKEPDPYARFKKGVEQLKYSDFKILLNSFLNTSGDLPTLTSNLEKWYNDYMDRVSGWYKTHTRKGLLLIAAVVTLALNVDTIRVARELNTNTALRTQVANAAEKYANDRLAQVESANADSLVPKDSLVKIINELRGAYDELNEFELPIGWTKVGNDKTVSGQPSKNKGKSESFWEANGINGWTPFGWIITMMAISFGAPFWFDLLNKLVNIRSAGKRPAEVPKS